MRVTDKTKYLDFQPFESCLAQSSIDALKKAAEAKYGDMWAQTIEEFFAHTEGDFSSIGVTEDLPNLWHRILIAFHLEKFGISVFQYYWVLRFKDWVDEFAKTINTLTPPQSPESKKASAGCIEVSFKESVLVFLKEYFNLHSFDDAQKMRVSDLVIAKKDSYNKAVFETAYSKQQFKKK